MGKNDGPFKYCYAYDISRDKELENGHYYKTVYYLKPDFSQKDNVGHEGLKFRVDKNGKIKTRAYGLLPLRYNYGQAYDKVKMVAEMLEKRAERKAKANRGFVKQDDDKMKITVLCRHKGEDKYGYKTYQLSPEDAAKRNKTLTLGRAKLAIKILDKMGVPHPNLDKIVA